MPRKASGFIPDQKMTADTSTRKFATDGDVWTRLKAPGKEPHCSSCVRPVERVNSWDENLWGRFFYVLRG